VQRGKWCVVLENNILGDEVSHAGPGMGEPGSGTYGVNKFGI